MASPAPCPVAAAAHRVSAQQRGLLQILLASFVRAATWTRDAGELLNELARAAGLAPPIENLRHWWRPEAGSRVLTHGQCRCGQVSSGDTGEALRVVHEIYRSPPNTGSDRVSELSIMMFAAVEVRYEVRAGEGERRTQRGSAESRLVHIRHIHIGGFGPPVERYFIMVGARRQRGAGDPSEREREG